VSIDTIDVRTLTTAFLSVPRPQHHSARAHRARPSPLPFMMPNNLIPEQSKSPIYFQVLCNCEQAPNVTPLYIVSNEQECRGTMRPTAVCSFDAALPSSTILLSRSGFIRSSRCICVFLPVGRHDCRHLSQCHGAPVRVQFTGFNRGSVSFLLDHVYHTQQPMSLVVSVIETSLPDWFRRQRIHHLFCCRFQTRTRWGGFLLVHMGLYQLEERSVPTSPSSVGFGLSAGLSLSVRSIAYC